MPWSEFRVFEKNMKNTGKFSPELQEKYGFCLSFMSCLYHQGISFNACILASHKIKAKLLKFHWSQK